MITTNTSEGNSQDFEHRFNECITRQYSDGAAPGVAVCVQTNGERYTRFSGLADLKTGTPISARTQFRLASVSKQFTARAVYELMKEGKLKDTTPLGTILEGLPPVLRPVTIRQLLEHRSGVWDYETLIPQGQQAQLSDEDVLHLIQAKDTTYFKPGTHFRYSNTGYCLLALVVEKITKTRYEIFVKDRIFLPLHIQQALVFNPGQLIPARAYGYHPKKNGFQFADQSVTSATKGDGGVYMCIEEYNRWIDEVMASASGKTAYFQAVQHNGALVKSGVRYSLGWFVNKEEDGSIALFHSGESTGFHNIVYLNPQRKIRIVIFSNRDDLKIAALFKDLAALLNINPVTAATDRGLFEWLSKVYSDGY